MTFVVDIDDTIVFSIRRVGPDYSAVEYEVTGHDAEEIGRINRLKADGNVIILFTGRSWGAYSQTVEILARLGVHYDQLVMGKPLGVYIDKDAKTSLKEFVR